MNHKHRWPAAAAALAIATTGLAAAQPARARPQKCPTLEISQGWYGGNKSRLQQLIDDWIGDSPDPESNK